MLVRLILAEINCIAKEFSAAEARENNKNWLNFWKKKWALAVQEAKLINLQSLLLLYFMWLSQYVFIISPQNHPGLGLSSIGAENVQGSGFGLYSLKLPAGRRLSPGAWSKGERGILIGGASLSTTRSDIWCWAALFVSFFAIGVRQTLISQQNRK